MAESNGEVGGGLKGDLINGFCQSETSKKNFINKGNQISVSPEIRKIKMAGYGTQNGAEVTAALHHEG